MPVSKKRKKDGKPVHRSAPAPGPSSADPAAPGTAPAPAEKRFGKPANPFVAAQQMRRAAQRGR